MRRRLRIIYTIPYPEPAHGGESALAEFRLGPPPKQESKCVREIFSRVLQTRLGPREIARVAFGK
jgi:hypothetical protein